MLVALNYMPLISPDNHLAILGAIAFANLGIVPHDALSFVFFAAMVGVLGYAIGTVIGTLMFKFWGVLLN